MKILIGTPAYGESVTTTYCETLIWILNHFREKHPHIAFEHKFLAFALLPHMRNYFASRVLNDQSYTHLLFIDSDMGFAPTLIEHMIALDKTVVGCVYPKRKLDLARLSELTKSVGNLQVARLIAQDYVGAGASIEFNGEASIDNLITEGPAIKVKHAGTGVMLIQRQVFEAIKKRYPELWAEDISDSYANFGLKGGVLQCFESLVDQRGIYVGEDVSFCHRWREGCGGEIWSVVTETIVHKGADTFVGRYLTKLEHGAA
jgi:hypothetical protein